MSVVNEGFRSLGQDGRSWGGMGEQCWEGIYWKRRCIHFVLSTYAFKTQMHKVHGGTEIGFKRQRHVKIGTPVGSISEVPTDHPWSLESSLDREA